MTGILNDEITFPLYASMALDLPVNVRQPHHHDIRTFGLQLQEPFPRGRCDSQHLHLQFMIRTVAASSAEQPQNDSHSPH